MGSGDEWEVNFHTFFLGDGEIQGTFPQVFFFFLFKLLLLKSIFFFQIESYNKKTPKSVKNKIQ